MAKAAEIKIAEDIEYRVIGNLFGLLIASAGLVAGEMVRLRSFDYWLNDIAPLLFVSWMLFRLYRNFLSTMIAYQDSPVPPKRQAAGTAIQGEQVITGQLPVKPTISAEKVVEEVAKRIEAQKADALKKNKFTN